MRTMVLLLALTLSTSALALDFSQPVLDLDGKPFCQDMVGKDGECAPDKAWTLARLARAALNAQFPDEQNLSVEEKYKRGKLAQSLTGTGDMKLKSEDVALLKKMIGRAFPPSMMTAAWDLLEP